MSGNQLANAGFQDGTTGWSASGGLVMSVDTTQYGYEGRSVLVGTKNVILNEDVYLIAGAANKPEVVTGETVEVFLHGHYNLGQLQPYVRFNGGNDRPVPLIKKGDDNPRLGLSSSFDFFHARMVAPDTGEMELTFRRPLSTGAGVGKLLVMRPYLEVLPSANTKYRCWDPGSSINPDLDLAHWPSDLPHLRADAFTVEPIPMRKGFATDSGIETTKQILNEPWYRIQGSVRINQETHSILDQFFRNNKEFWFVRPDTLQLCIATWLADGDPVYSGLGSDKMASFGLQLHVL